MATEGAIDGNSTLFKPLRIGRLTLSHRLVMAPCTRFRADENHTILDVVPEYYAERGSLPGTLLITEATSLSPWACGRDRVPMIYTDQQVAAWKWVADAVHARGSFIFMQLNIHGRVADQDVRDAEGTGPVYSSSPIRMPDETRVGNYVKPSSMPVELSEEDVQRAIQEYAEAAKRAVLVAGFDGVEVHGAHGFLIDQFIQATCNQSTDRWGGSNENRARFALEVTRAVAHAVGSDRTAIRLSPWGTFRGMGMRADAYAQYTYLLSQLSPLNLAYLHLVDSRGDSGDAIESESNRPLIEAWNGTSPVILASGYTVSSAQKAVDEEYKGIDVAVALGRHFISTPDLVFRAQRGIPMNPYQRQFFYHPPSRVGYIDYPFSKEWMEERAGITSTGP